MRVAARSLLLRGAASVASTNVVRGRGTVNLRIFGDSAEGGHGLLGAAGAALWAAAEHEQAAAGSIDGRSGGDHGVGGTSGGAEVIFVGATQQGFQGQPSEAEHCGGTMAARLECSALLSALR